MILTKHINFEGQMIIAVIDDELLGHNYETDELQLDFSSKFYAGEAASEEIVISEMLKSYMAICAGEDTIRMLIDKQFITRDDVNIIAGIPYVYVSVGDQ